MKTDFYEERLPVFLGHLGSYIIASEIKVTDFLYKECGYKVLLITSRRATADAQAKKLDADKKFHFSKLYEDEGW